MHDGFVRRLVVPTQNLGGMLALAHPALILEKSCQLSAHSTVDSVSNQDTDVDLCGREGLTKHGPFRATHSEASAISTICRSLKTHCLQHPATGFSQAVRFEQHAAISSRAVSGLVSNSALCTPHIIGRKGEYHTFK